MIAEGQVFPDRVGYNALPWKYAAGTPDILGTIVSAQALRLDPPASCRLSFYLYDTLDDVDRAADALAGIVGGRCDRTTFWDLLRPARRTRMCSEPARSP